MDAAITLLSAFLSSVFLALQAYFYAQGDPSMGVLMCGMCLMCCGLCAGWHIAGKRRGGDGE